MSEAVAFLLGLMVANTIWYISDYMLHDSIYRTGYRKGFEEAIKQKQ